MQKSTRITTYILILIVILAIVATAYYKLTKRNTKKSAVPIIPVSVMRVHMHTVPIKVSAIGTVVPVQQTNISPKEDGYAKAIYFQDGEYVHKNQLLIQLDDAKLKATVQGDKAQVLVTGSLYRRYLQANKMNLIKAQDFETVQANYETAKATLAEDKVSLANTRLAAPFSGYIGAKNFSVGDLVKSGDKLTQLVDKRHLIIEYVLPATNAVAVKLQQVVNVKFNNKKTVIGKVIYIAPSIDTNTATIAVHAQINSPKFNITPGEFVEVEQTLGQKQALIVPEQSLIASLESYHLFTVQKGKAQSVNVQVGENNFGHVEIQYGLKNGEVVIVAGAQQIKDGQKVHITSGKS